MNIAELLCALLELLIAYCECRPHRPRNDSGQPPEAGREINA